MLLVVYVDWGGSTDRIDRSIVVLNRTPSPHHHNTTRRSINHAHALRRTSTTFSAKDCAMPAKARCASCSSSSRSSRCRGDSTADSRVVEPPLSTPRAAAVGMGAVGWVVGWVGWGKGGDGGQGLCRVLLIVLRRRRRRRRFDPSSIARPRPPRPIGRSTHPSAHSHVHPPTRTCCCALLLLLGRRRQVGAGRHHKGLSDPSGGQGAQHAEGSDAGAASPPHRGRRGHSGGGRGVVGWFSQSRAAVLPAVCVWVWGWGRGSQIDRSISSRRRRRRGAECK